ncbi:MAG TPA: orotate phosphoribosyltransferase [Dokdonella sp.]|uniref:orotate phosphoribosyltransferase n=1 Tax=Dokdonella sp. TaxID=2291710 RepID=UPI002D809BDB|nr:orotate phosphoribosyltransferase [Dokdonella sp.]HET9031308.1 orotate phosphoribosyltransferase [Dokdonella sp.]
MQAYQRDFLDLAIARNVLKFGEFTLKSGRVSPYFFNAGLFDSGAALSALGKCYAAAAANAGLSFDLVFGPAYKGIALAALTAAALAERHGIDCGYAYNRKEAKTHGEGGNLVGAPLAGRILIVDDVITAGTAIRESLKLIQSQAATPAGVLIALDREERGTGARSAAQEVTAEFGIPVVSIVGLGELLAYAGEHEALAGERTRLEEYRARFGV